MPSFPTLHPAFKSVSSDGSTYRSPVILYQPNTVGIYLDRCRVEYVPELLGPYMNLSYSQRWRLLGYRIAVSMAFSFLDATAFSGLSVLRTFYTDGLSSESYAKLQFSMWYPDTPDWIGIRPTGSFSPRPAQDRQGSGWQLELAFESVDLRATVGDWNSKGLI